MLMLILAVVLGGAAAFLAQGLLRGRNFAPQAVDKGPAMTTIVVASRPLHFGDAINRDVVSEVAWPANATPKDAFNKADELFAKPGKRVALRGIVQDEPLLKSRVSGFGGRAILSTLIDEKMRGITIRVSDVNGVAGFVMPGDRVDVLLTRNEGSSGQNSSTTETLLQNIKVLGVDQDANEEADKPRVVKAVTVEVTPEDTQKLALASTVGSLSLALRNVTNTAEAQLPRITIRDLGVAPSRPAAPVVLAEPTPLPARATARREMPTMIVVRGIEAKVEEVVPDLNVARSAASVKRSAKTPSSPSAPQPKAAPIL